MTPYNRLSRDPAGFRFALRGTALVQVNRAYTDEYDHLIESGLYRALLAENRSARYDESGLKFARTDAAYRVLREGGIDDLLTYAHEWPFGAWKAGALTVLRATEIALDHGMVTRRAGTSSVRLNGTHAVLADPLAFEFYDETRRWAAYEQFVREWLAPLALMSTVAPSLGALARAYPEGIPPETVSALLPVRTRVNFGLAAHLHFGGREFLAGRTDEAALRDTLGGLRETVEGLRYTPGNPTNDAGYVATDDDEASADHRQLLLRGYLAEILPDVVWDMFAGDGALARVAADAAPRVVAFTPSAPAAARLWAARAAGAPEVERIQVVLQDWTNPTSNGGWGYREIRSIAARGAPGLLLALDWVHRLAVGSGYPLLEIAATLARLAPHAVVEFIPPTDPAVIAQLRPGQSVEDHYNAERFEAAFRDHYDVLLADGVKHTDRTLYLLRRKSES